MSDRRDDLTRQRREWLEALYAHLLDGSEHSQTFLAVAGDVARTINGDRDAVARLLADDGTLQLVLRLAQFGAAELLARAGEHHRRGP